MVRHVVLFKFTAGATDGQIAAMEAGLASLPAAIPGIARYEFGRDLRYTDGNFDFALVADFADADACRAYGADATHLQVVVDHVRPITDAVVRVQYEV